MTYELLPTEKILNETLCAMQLFRMLGYLADDIYVMFGNQEDPNLILVLLKPKVGETFALGIGITSERPNDFSKKWEAAANAWNSMDAEKAMELFHSSDVRKQAITILSTMVLKGLKFPNAGNMSMSLQPEARA